MRTVRSSLLAMALVTAGWGTAHAQKTAAVAPDTTSAEDAARVAELSEKARAIVNADSNTDPLFHPDGKRLIFSSTRDGLPQLYLAELASPGAAPTRITRTNERAIRAVPLAGGGAILFRSDRGGDENWSIFKIGLDGQNLVELTPGERLQRDSFAVPDGASDTMFYSARKMSEPASAVYAQKIEPGSKPRRIYGEEVPGSLMGVSRDGKRALWMRQVSASESAILLVDVDTGAARPLYPAPSRKLRIVSASFSYDASRVYLTSDEGGDQGTVLALAVADGKELARYVEKRSASALLAVCPSPKSDRVLVTVAAGDHIELTLLDAATLKPAAPVKFPLGLGFPGRCEHAFSPDGRRVLISWSTPQAPFDLHAIDVASGKVSPLHKQALPALAALPAIDTSVVETKAFDGGRIPMLVYRPRGVRGKLPVIVSYHGGPSAVSIARWDPQIRFYTSLGYAYVEPNVRGSFGYGRAFEEADNGRKRLDAFRDIETSARWVAAQPWADKDRLVVFGGSYGGYTTLIGLTRQPDLWRAGVDLFGIADVRTLLKTTSGFIRDLFKLEFGELGKDDEFLGSISPIKDVDKIVDPLFVYAGANDTRVPRSESDMIVAAARKNGIPVEYMVKDNEGHSLERKDNQVRVLRALGPLPREARRGPGEEVAARAQGGQEVVARK
jgi:dipeptidyl aminopeptidase/acylaminoacyl peptidase